MELRSLPKNFVIIPVAGYASTKHYDCLPNILKKMISDVKKLSKVYRNSCRVDFKSSVEEPVFGEFTPTLRKGKEVTRYGSKKLVKAWGKNCKALI